MTSADIIAHYQSLLAEHGGNHKAVQYSDVETQMKRFKVLSEISVNLTSVLDVGCGLADLYHFLRAQGYESRYLGVDIVPEFVALAQGATALDPDATAQHIKPNDALPMGYDYVMLSGVFNNKMDDNWGFMTSMLRQMFASAGKAIAFNAMTTHVDYHDDELYYVDPMDVVNFCKTELGGHPVLRHDYVLREGGFPFEFAIYVFKDPLFIELD